MALTIKKNIKERLRVEAITYNRFVPFYNICTVCDHILISNDTLEPLSDEKVASSNLLPVPSFGAMYRLTGDGVHSPNFSIMFKKSSGSGDYDSTYGVLNLVTFIFDGVDYWYSIVQPQ
jgi:hypothetical protein